MSLASSTPAATDTPPCVVVGLGNIGGAIATRLAASGANVVGVDLVAGLRDSLAASAGLPTHAALADAPLAEGSRVLVVVRTADQAAAVLTELAQLATTRGRCTAFVVTTLDITTAEGLDRHIGPVLDVIELPVSGGRGGALAGTLTLLAAGALTDADERFLLAHVGTHLVRFERFGEPTAAKLHNNLLAAYNARAHAEILLAAAERGIDPVRLDEVLRHSSGGSWMGEHLEVVVDDLLAKDVALFEESYGPSATIAVGAGSELEAALASARTRLAGRP